MHESRPPIEVQNVEVSCAVQLHYLADVDVASTRTRHAMMHLIELESVLIIIIIISLSNV